MVKTKKKTLDIHKRIVANHFAIFNQVFDTKSFDLIYKFILKHRSRFVFKCINFFLYLFIFEGEKILTFKPECKIVLRFNTLGNFFDIGLQS